MLQDPRAARAVQAFVTWWLGLDRLTMTERDATRFPEFSPLLRESMFEEPRLFASHVVFKGRGTLSELLTAPYSFVDNQLARIYGTPLADDSFRMASFSRDHQRAGILTQPGVLAVQGGPDRHSGPVRGAHLLERVMCFQVPPPPADVAIDIPPESARPGQSLRQAMEQLVSREPACTACHQLLQVGFVFEPFDAIGRRRTTDNGAPINSSARLPLVDGSNNGVTSVNDPVDLMTQLASMDAVRTCFASHWLEFAVGRELTPLDQEVARALAREAARTDFDIRELIARVTLTLPFLEPR